MSKRKEKVGRKRKRGGEIMAAKSAERKAGREGKEIRDFSSPLDINGRRMGEGNGSKEKKGTLVSMGNFSFFLSFFLS